MALVHLDAWQTMSSEGGSALAFDRDRLAIAGAARLCIRRFDATLASVVAPAPAPGVPRFAGPEVYWGPGVLDLRSGTFRVLEGALPARRPGGGERPQVYAWSPQGNRLLGSFSTGNSNAPTRVSLFDGRTGTTVATLWNGAGIPPQAAWAGGRAIVVGFGTPRVFDHAGKHLADVALNGATVVAIDSDTRERRLIAVDLNRAIAWIEPETWTILDRWPGTWLHAAISPDGAFVAALEPWGKIHFACLEGDRFKPVGTASAPPDAVALALSPNEIATIGGGEVNRTKLTVDCVGGAI
jgi:hypothetical protein